MKYKRIVLKLSGEALAGENDFGINPPVVEDIAKQIKKVHDAGLEVAIVVGGGNIWRGLSGSAKGLDRAQADYVCLSTSRCFGKYECLYARSNCH